LFKDPLVFEFKVRNIVGNHSNLWLSANTHIKVNFLKFKNSQKVDSVFNNKFNGREVELNIVRGHVEVVVSMEVHLDVNWVRWVYNLGAFLADPLESGSAGREWFSKDSLPHG